MKVFKIIKYHIPYSDNSTHALCHREQRLSFSTTSTTATNDSCYTLSGFYSQHEYYEESMDLCKICRQINFRRIVNKLKGRG